MSIQLVLFDFLPVFLFFINTVLFWKTLSVYLNKNYFGFACSGLILICMGGLGKAIWKGLYATNIMDFQVFDESQLFIQSCGFFLFAIGLIGLNLKKSGSKLAAAPMLFTSSIPFIVVMSVGLLWSMYSLVCFNLKRKNYVSVVFFILATILLFLMSYLGSKEDFSFEFVNWIAESINSFAQIALLVANTFMYKRLAK
ncbi:MAG: hypothetical protein HUJ62_11045 [Streptococcus gallolyticus]|nr:hypothetical protein [Streptococcus gallolyticus]